MLKLVNAFLISAVVFIAGCAAVEMPTDAQSWINEGRVTNVAIAQAVLDNVNNEIMTPAEGQAVLDKVKEYVKALDEAQKLLDTGLALQAEDKAKLVNNLITSLHREVSKKARQEKVQ